MDWLGSDFPFSSSALVGKHAIVCGASKGIGAATAKMLAKAGAKVTAVSRNPHDLVGELEGDGHTGISLDLEDKVAIDKLISTIEECHILINNAAGPPGGPLLDNQVEDFEAPFRRHLHASHTLVRGLVPKMEAAGMGRIVNIISTSVKQVIPGLGVSNTIRGSVAQWGKTLALELGENGICVNNILPGYTATDRLNYLAESKANSLGMDIEDIRSQWAENTSLKRIGNVDEVANTVLFLSSDESSYITGHNFSVDGGRFSA